MLSLVVPSLCQDSQTIEASYLRVPSIMPQGYHTSLLGVTQAAPHGPRGISSPSWTAPYPYTQLGISAWWSLRQHSWAAFVQLGIRSHDQGGPLKYAMESAMYNGTTGPPGWVKRYL